MRRDGGDTAASLPPAFVEAVRALTPVVVDLGTDQPKLDAYLDRIDVDGGRSVLRLAPIAAGFLSPAHDRVRLRPAAGRAGWELTASGIVALGDHVAAIDLARARVLEVEDDEPSRACHDSIVLIVPGGVAGHASYVFPVCRIGPELCEIRATVPLEPGLRLELVEIVGDRRVLRRASAEVLETIPWYLVDGAACFRCRLSFGPVPSDPSRPYDVVSEPAEVRRLLTFAGTAMATGFYEAPGWGRGGARFVAVGPAEATIDLSPAPKISELPRGSIRVAADLLAAQYEMEVRVLDRDGDRVHTSLPLILRRRRRDRRAHRTPILEGTRVEVTFLHPVTGGVETRPVTELSFFAVRFAADPLRGALWEGLPLERATLRWSDRRQVPLGDLEVAELGLEDGRLACTASIGDSRVVDDPEMIELLATMAHPRISVHDGADFDVMHRMYLEAGLFAPHMHRNLAPIAAQVAGVWRRAHAGASDVVRTLIHGSAEAPDSAMTVMRAWEAAWVLQHFIDVNPKIDGASGRLQHAYLDHLLPRPDGRYLVFFVKEDNHVMNAYLRRFFAGTGTSEAMSRCSVEFWSHPGRAADALPASLQPAAGPRLEVRPLRTEDHVLVSRAAERALGSAGAAALSLQVGEIDLPDTKARYARAGLARERDCRVVCVDGAPAYAIVEERATPGLNLTWMLNASWLLPIHASADGPSLSVALDDVLRAPPQSATGERFVNAPAGGDESAFASAGFRREATVYMYVVNRAGLHRLFHYTAERCGELEALIARRRVLGRGREPS